jgi:DNA repair exonuclease SbcCD ATPase subunit
VKRRLDEYNHNIQQLREHVEEELVNISESLDQAKEDKQDLKEQGKKVEQRIEQYSAALESASEMAEKLSDESFEAGIQEFSEAWEEAYNAMNSNLELDIDIDEEGRVRFPGRNSLREYDRGGNLSGSELHLLNISFACTLSKFATQNNVIDWDVVVLDEPFSNLQEQKNRKAALNYVTGLDNQVIVTTSNESLGPEFDNVEVLEREALQTRIGDFV